MQNGLTVIDLNAANRSSPPASPLPKSCSNAPPPDEVSGRAVCIFSAPMMAGEEHYATIEIGAPTVSKPVLARLHSAALPGDIMGSLKM